MEEKILEAEQELAARQHDVQESSSDANRLPLAFERLQQAQIRVNDLYQRWADLDAKVVK